MFKELDKATFREVPEALVALTKRVVADVLSLDDYRGRRGRKGNVGRQGDPGERGPEGAVGRPGLDGIDGATGAMGERGETGKRGKRGYKGLQGRQGEVGPQGPKGDKGDAGPMPAHKWDGTRLAFQKPDGKFGRAVELRGPGGGRGGAGTTEQFKSIGLNGANLEFKKLGAMGSDFSVDLSSLGGGGEVSQAQRVDEVGDVMYIGTAAPGTAEAAASWAIRRLTFTYTGSETDIDTEWANGAATADRQWTNRLSETYS
jgi:hypothetical protein